MKRPNRLANRNAKRRGAYTVEFAICAGILFMVIMASLEFTRLVFAKHAVDQAAYEAARVAIVPGASSAQVTTQARRLLDATGIKSATITLTPPTITSATRQVTVNVRAPFAANTWVPTRFFTGTVIQATTTLDHEQASYKLAP